jgi:hypothetical protein
VPIVLKYGSLKLLELSGPVQACNGIVLSFILNSKRAIASPCLKTLLTLNSEDKCLPILTLEYIYLFFFNFAQFKYFFTLLDAFQSILHFSTQCHMLLQNQLTDDVYLFSVP